jgi:LAO/AO transport system kinase
MTRRQVARALTQVEEGAPAPEPGAAVRVFGVTGAPGAGKSTLVAAMIGELRRRGHKVGVLAVDPSSPFTGGALLGDRIRMGGHEEDEGVFIRSMATRGALGGVAPATGAAARVLAAAGFDVILIETVGVGQAEIEISRIAEKTAVVLTPNMGDDVQAAKAGILEIADVLVLNKADLAGAERLERQLLEDLGDVPLKKTNAVAGEGVGELVEYLLAVG